MTYSLQLIKLFFAVDDHIFRIGKAEEVKRPWKVVAFLCVLSVIVYTGMAVLGIGSSALSNGAVLLDSAEYELRKFWFIIGRAIFSLVFVLLVIFVPAFIFYWITKIPFKKLILMQLPVLFVLLVERLIWIPLVVYVGLDWYVSPLSFGIIASYLTDIPFLVYLCGAVSLFQLWIISFHIRFLSRLSNVHKGWIWSTVLLFHIAVWSVTAVVTFTDVHLVKGWFA